MNAAPQSGNMQPWGGDHHAARTHRTSSDASALAEAPKFTVTLLIPTDAIGLLIGKVRRFVRLRVFRLLMRREMNQPLCALLCGACPGVLTRVWCVCVVLSAFSGRRHAERDHAAVEGAAGAAGLPRRSAKGERPRRAAHWNF